MPYQVIVNTNIQNPYAEVEFIDESGNKVNAPSGVQVEFSSDTPSLIDIAPDPNNSLRGKITLPLLDNPVVGQAFVHFQVTGADDTDNQPFQDQYIKVIVTPAVPATEAMITFQVSAPPPPDQST